MEEDNQRLFASMLSSKASMSSSPLVQPLVEVQRVPRKGRCLVASRDVGAGTLLLAEDPFVLVAAGRRLAPGQIEAVAPPEHVDLERRERRVRGECDEHIFSGVGLL